MVSQRLRIETQRQWDMKSAGVKCLDHFGAQRRHWIRLVYNTHDRDAI